MQEMNVSELDQAISIRADGIKADSRKVMSPLDILAKPEDVPLTRNEKTSLTSTIPNPPGARRSSSRSIKRPKFDDELVEASAFKRSASRKTSESSPSDVKAKKPLSKQSSVTSTPLQPKKKNKKIKPRPVPSDFGRWRPSDDLTLINAVTQTCDLQTVHFAVRFSCNFTLKEIQDRWFALLYDPLVSRLAQQSMKALPADVVNNILQNVLWAREEDCVLADVDVNSAPTIRDFQKLLDENITVFHKSRTAKTLQNHWLLLRHYQLLTCQTGKIHSGGTPQTLAEMEAKIVDDQLAGPENEILNQEMAHADRCVKREIKKLEQEIPQWEIMIEKSGYVEDLELSDFKDDTLAVMKGRILKFCIKKDKVILGRKNTDCEVDIDLSIEGPALKVSRKQGVLTYSGGTFTLLNCGRRVFYVNGEPLVTDGSTTLSNNSVIEIYCLKLLFIINPAILSGKITSKPVEKKISDSIKVT